jgi:uncharacterized protein YecT (DUF1311 family)/sugar lactone lactonase YvrE
MNKLFVALTGNVMRFLIVLGGCAIAAILTPLLIPQIHAQTQASMNAQGREEFVRADAELNKTYKALLAKLRDTESKQKLKETQRAWITSRDADAAHAADEAGGGSMAATIRYETMTQLTQQRIKQLKTKLAGDASPDEKDASTPTPAATAISLDSARGLAFDSNGNLLVADSGTGTILKFTPEGTLSTFASGLTDPRSLAFDGKGNLFVAQGNWRPNSRNGTILKFTPQGTRRTFASGLSGLDDLTVDKVGNLFVSEFNEETMFKFAPDGTKTSFATSMHTASGLAVDQSGNLFVSEIDKGTIFKFAPDGTKTAFASGLGDLWALAFDPAGNLFVADVPKSEAGMSASGTIFKFAPDGTKTAFTTSVNTPIALVFDKAGDLFVSDSGSVFKFTPDGTRSTLLRGSSYPISPDNRWEYRSTAEDELNIIKAGTNEVALDLSDKVPNARILWAPDSKRFALNYGQGKTHETSLYQLRGHRWEELKSAQDAISQRVGDILAAQLKRKGLSDEKISKEGMAVHHIWWKQEVDRWIDSNAAILYASEEKVIAEEGFGYHLLFTLRFDESGNCKIIKTHRMSEKEVEERGE